MIAAVLPRLTGDHANRLRVALRLTGYDTAGVRALLGAAEPESAVAAAVAPAGARSGSGLRAAAPGETCPMTAVAP
ncbi:MAG: hypothetical protein ACRDSL_01025 [Pseudonocardiaceae bacterium]